MKEETNGTTGWTAERVMAVLRLSCTLASTAAAGFGLTVDAESLLTGATCVAAAACYAWSWWSNNNITDAACEAQEYLDMLRDHPGGED